MIILCFFWMKGRLENRPFHESAKLNHDFDAFCDQKGTIRFTVDVFYFCTWIRSLSAPE